MLDSDIARPYECINETEDINKAIKRNSERFPERLIFRLMNSEYESLRF